MKVVCLIKTTQSKDSMEASRLRKKKVPPTDLFLAAVEVSRDGCYEDIIACRLMTRGVPSRSIPSVSSTAGPLDQGVFCFVDPNRRIVATTHMIHCTFDPSFLTTGQYFAYSSP